MDGPIVDYCIILIRHISFLTWYLDISCLPTAARKALVSPNHRKENVQCPFIVTYFPKWSPILCHKTKIISFKYVDFWTKILTHHRRNSITELSLLSKSKIRLGKEIPCCDSETSLMFFKSIEGVTACALPIGGDF